MENKDEKHTKKGKKLSKKFYENELNRLQVELVRLQEWIKFKGLKVVVIFEGRDAAGKGGTIKRIIQTLNPRICRVVALVFSALCAASSRCRRDGFVRPQLV
jgi:polyphosphate kinase 2 (PPK2 family)